MKAYPSISDIPEQVDLAVIVTPPPSIPGHHPRVRRERRAGRHRDLGRLQGNRAGGRGAGAAVAGGGAGGQHAHHRPELPGRDEPALGHERHLRHRHRAARHRRLHQPERRAVHGGSRLEPEGKGRLQRLRLGRLDARRGLGRPDLLPRQRSQDASPSSSTWRSIGDARSFLSAAREVALQQADHRHQAGPHGGRRQGRRVAHRLADRQRRGAGRRLPAQRRAARQHHRRPVLHGRGARQAAPPARDRA